MSDARSRSLVALAGFGLVTAGAAWYGARYSRNGNRDSWYRQLDKPSFTPPDRVFPVVWSTLYALIAYSGWRVWKRGTLPAARRGPQTLDFATSRQCQMVKTLLWPAPSSDGAGRHHRT